MEHVSPPQDAAAPPAMSGPAWHLANAAASLNEACRFDDAAARCLEAIAIDPACWNAWCNLGHAMVEQARYDDAIAAYANCLTLHPGWAPALCNMGVALFRRGEPGRAITFLELAVGLEPANAEARCNLGQALLACGDFVRGFAEYEWRWRTAASPPAPLSLPRWHGEHGEGRTILLHEEGGFGDTLQFVRFAPLVRARGLRVVLRVRRPLVSLLARAPGIDAVVADDAAIPAADLECPLLSLPFALGTTIDRIPSPGGYLAADPTRVAAWQARLAPAARPGGTRRLHVGLCWAGAPRHGMRGASLADRRRSTTRASFAALAALVPGAVFHSLQVGAPRNEKPGGIALVDHTAAVADFDDTAALISLLDAVVAVDTSTAHLAGALGCPVLMLSRYDQCWRWLAGRSDTPWYDSMTVLRQERPGDWTAPLIRAAALLNGPFGATLPRREVSATLPRQGVSSRVPA